MAKIVATVLPMPWQAAQRPDGWWLQQMGDDGAWRDVAGPYLQRGGAINRWRRIVTASMLPPSLNKSNSDKQALLAAAC